MARPPSRKSVLEDALAHLRGGRPREALGILEAEIRERGEDRDLLFLSALALEDLDQPGQALKAYERLLASAPEMADAFHNRGLLLVRLGRFREAEESHRQYVKAHPDSPQARLDLADILLAASRYDEAISQIDAIPHASLMAPALLTRALALASLGRFSEAGSAIAGAKERDPTGFTRHVERIAPNGDPDVVLAPENVFLWRGYIAQQQCQWSGWDRYASEFRKAANNPGAQLEPALSFAALHVPLTPQDRLALARRTASKIESTAPALPQVASSERAKVRVGILSPDFRDHLNARLLLPLFELSDRSRLEMIAYSLAADDGSAILERIKTAAARFVDLAPLSDASAAMRIRADGVDILVDVGGHTAGARFGIVARRPAPLQAQYLGFAGSLGSARIDYAIVDPVVAPEGSESEWSEALVRLPSTYYLYDFREQARQKVSRREYGLPDDGFVFCAFHKAEKISPESFELWMAMLRRTERSVMWFLSPSEAAVANLRSAAGARGIDPARLVFAPFESRERYLSRHSLGDLMVDAVHHNAMTTACDAMSVGLPLLTLKGNSMVARAGESLVRAAGLPELVAHDRGDFVEKAVRLASGRVELEALRARLAARRDAQLFDTPSRVSELESAFLQMHENAARGAGPRPIMILPAGRRAREKHPEKGP